MRRPLHSSPAPRSLCFFGLAALSLFAGCGKLQSWYTHAQAQSDSAHSVTITWTASKSIVAGYNVYRLSPSGDPVKVSKGIVSETRYVDKPVEAGRTYSYYVKSVDFRGIESKPSETITVTVPSSGTPPANQ
jgi:fibronectin type 3 domain-containing protein